MRIHRIKHTEMINDMGKCVQMPESIVAVLPKGEIKHLKFFDDDFVILIFSGEGNSSSAMIPQDTDCGRYFPPAEHTL